MSARAHRQLGGAWILPGGGVRFRLWAPGCDVVRLLIEGEADPRPLTRSEDGWHEILVPDAGHGALYRFGLPDGTQVPDPGSRFQPDDVHGPSEVIDPAAYDWTTRWSGRPWSEVVLYELHIGAFTREGTFRAAIDKLDHLADLGVTGIEIMPVWDFPGQRNWGYDGVLPYAPDSSYGRPDDFKALIEAAHARGIAVILDVVYNHFGPDGNYLPAYAPGYFTKSHATPWGDAVNFDAPGSGVVRELTIDNALYWLEEYDLDGLRLDAVHAIIDDSPVSILEEIATRIRAVQTRPTHLVLEDEDNRAHLLTRDDCAPRLYTAQWNDDVHHVLHVAATGEADGYYADYVGRTDLLARALAEGFAFQGQVMPYRGSPRGEPSAALPPQAFIAFLQNHDQVGNRAFGDRISASVARPILRALAAVYLLLPQVPMLFMGEEWGAAQPFPYFCDFDGPLGAAVRDGRRQEFARFPQFQDPDQREKIPDPQAEATFLSAKLDWDAIDPDLLSHYRGLITARREHVMPLIASITHGGDGRVLGPGAVEVRWRCDDGRGLILAANLSDAAIDYDAPAGTPLWNENPAPTPLGPWQVLWTLESA